MGIIKKNKKGVSLAELLAAIAIIGLASSTITTIVITSYKGQIIAQKYVLANEIAKTFDSMLAKDITKENLSTLTDAEIAGDSETDKYTTVTKTLLEKMCAGNSNPSTPYGQAYECLYTTNFALNGMQFNSSNVTLRIYVISKNFGYFKTEILVKYQGDRQVTYSGTHFKE